VSFSDRLVTFLSALPEARGDVSGAWQDNEGRVVDLGSREVAARAVADARMRDDAGKPYDHWYVPTFRSGDWSTSASPLRLKLSASFEDRIAAGAPQTENVILSAEGDAARQFFRDHEALVRIAARAWQPDEVLVSERELTRAQIRLRRRVPAVRESPSWGFASWFRNGTVDGPFPGAAFGEGVLFAPSGTAETVAEAWGELVASGVRRRPVVPQESLPVF